MDQNTLEMLMSKGEELGRAKTHLEVSEKQNDEKQRIIDEQQAVIERLKAEIDALKGQVMLFKGACSVLELLSQYFILSKGKLKSALLNFRKQPQLVASTLFMVESAMPEDIPQDDFMEMKRDVMLTGGQPDVENNFNGTVNNYGTMNGDVTTTES